MPYGRKSALKRNKPGGGFGQSLMKGTGQASATHHLKPDIGRLRVNKMAAEEGGGAVKLTTFISRDQNVTALETNDFEDFVQMSLFKKVGGRDLVICNRDGRTFSTRQQAEITNSKKIDITQSSGASLASVALPIRPFRFIDKVTRIIELTDRIALYKKPDSQTLGVSQEVGEEGEGGAEGGSAAPTPAPTPAPTHAPTPAAKVEAADSAADSDSARDSDSDSASEASEDPTESSVSSDEGLVGDEVAELGLENFHLLEAIVSYFSEETNRMAPLLVKEEIEFVESNVFSEWRVYITELQRNSQLVLTPFEKNLSYWRELWRTLERSDLMLEIVDARNPLLFRSRALEEHIVSLGKKFRLCINKADHLSKAQCDVWTSYCLETLKLDQPPLIYSSMKELKKQDPLLHNDEFLSINTADDLSHLANVEDLTKYLDDECLRAIKIKHTRAITARKLYEELKSRIDNVPGWALARTVKRMRRVARKSLNCDHLPDEMRIKKSMTSTEFLKLLTGNSPDDVDGGVGGRAAAPPEAAGAPSGYPASPRSTASPATAEHLRFYVGFVGFPNVGKSSVINSLLRGKARVAVSRTPGKTRHLQTLKIPNAHENLWLCDCPGLVLPIMAGSREDLILNGVISVGAIRGSTQSVIDHLLARVSDQISEIYNCSPAIRPDSKALDVLEQLGRLRGFYKSGKGGLVDTEKMSRQLIKQFLEGRLLSFCELPPSCDKVMAPRSGGQPSGGAGAPPLAEWWLAEEGRKWLVRRSGFLKKQEVVVNSSKLHFR